MRNVKVAILLAIILVTGIVIAGQLRKISGTSRSSAGISASIGGVGGQSNNQSGPAPDGGTADAPDDLPVSQGRAAVALAEASTPAANPRIAAAQDQARARWSEFAEAWASRNDTQSFYIKKCFEDDGRTECLWCVVDRIDATTIAGRLDNDPLILGASLARGDEVTCPVEQINDWMITDAAGIRGAFTERAAREPGP